MAVAVGDTVGDAVGVDDGEGDAIGDSDGVGGSGVDDGEGSACTVGCEVEASGGSGELPVFACVLLGGWFGVTELGSFMGSGTSNS